MSSTFVAMSDPTKDLIVRLPFDPAEIEVLRIPIPRVSEKPSGLLPAVS